MEARVCLWLAALSLVSTLARAQSQTYTSDADFEMGLLSGVNHAATHDQLQLDMSSLQASLPILHFALSGNGTIARIDSDTGTFIGEYRTAPAGFAADPSRTCTDHSGNVWVGNRAEASLVDGVINGSVTKIGLCLGGTRVNASGVPDANGQYLKPPFSINTCVDRDFDGLIKTSRGLSDILPWNNLSDGHGGVDGLVQDAEPSLSTWVRQPLTPSLV
jgi:hypothetical protein